MESKATSYIRSQGVTVRNRRPLLAPAVLSVALLQVLPAAARAGDSEFHSLVERMSDYYQKRPMRFMGWLNFFANRFTPGGVSHFQMAIFDDVEASRTHPSEHLESSLASLVGPSYQPFVNVHNVRSGEWTCIYTRESGKEQKMRRGHAHRAAARACVNSRSCGPDFGVDRDWVLSRFFLGFGN